MYGNVQKRTKQKWLIKEPFDAMPIKYKRRSLATVRLHVKYSLSLVKFS